MRSPNKRSIDAGADTSSSPSHSPDKRRRKDGPSANDFMSSSPALFYQGRTYVAVDVPIFPPYHSSPPDGVDFPIQTSPAHHHGYGALDPTTPRAAQSSQSAHSIEPKIHPSSFVQGHDLKGKKRAVSPSVYPDNNFVSISSPSHSIDFDALEFDLPDNFRDVPAL
ncbi:hypothetical protein EV361DRAFT_1019151 [Lentinula raphanica]|nr:hypothetical protein EV361DRAFT_1019151 [Lentinula raphanica]